MALRVPVLMYHGCVVDGVEYSNNTHVAFAHDLRALTELGFTITSLTDVVDALLCGSRLPDRAVAITFDDGTDFDYHDLPHPLHGLQRSIINIMRDFRVSTSGDLQPHLHATSFVIVSPSARRDIDHKDLIGQDWIRDTWWKPAVESGLLGIANHSWDHNHPNVRHDVPRRETGTFKVIDSEELADLEVRRAYEYIQAVAPNNSSDLFAYPYGEASDFLVREYFPRGPEVTGVRAGFGTTPGPITQASNRWQLPRYVWGTHWHTPEELESILADL
jgi:peptidoglycan/xylan/chitin deacetylase (PgdA/CDA1 family)